MHLAQLNVARPRFPLEDPRMAGFVDNLDRVNAVAERSPGFVWRLIGDGNDATDDDPDLVVNMSVWQSAEHLEHFVWNTVHKAIYRRRNEWFPPLGKPHFVMWHVPKQRSGSITCVRTGPANTPSAGRIRLRLGRASQSETLDGRALRVRNG